MNKPIKKAVFPVGGLGTRFLPATKSMPKEMLPVASKPLIQYAFEEALEAGIEQFIFITGRNKNAIMNHFDHAYELETVLSEKEKEESLQKTRDWMPSAGRIAFTRQLKPLGLGHAVWCARHLVGDEPFAVLLADDMFLTKGKGVLSQMMEAYQTTENGNIIALHEVPRKETHRYGIVEATSPKEELVRISSMVEKPTPEAAPSTLAITGRYILQPEIFSYLENQHLGAGNEVQLTDAMAKMLSASSFYGLQCEGQRYDCGHALGFLEANIAYALADVGMQEEVKGMLQQFVC